MLQVSGAEAPAFTEAGHWDATGVRCRPEPPHGNVRFLLCSAFWFLQRSGAETRLAWRLLFFASSVSLAMRLIHPSQHQDSDSSFLHLAGSSPQDEHVQPFLPCRTNSIPPRTSRALSAKANIWPPNNSRPSFPTIDKNCMKLTPKAMPAASRQTGDNHSRAATLSRRTERGPTNPQRSKSRNICA